MSSKRLAVVICAGLATFILAACSPKPPSQATAGGQTGTARQGAPGAGRFGAVPVLAVVAKVAPLSAGNDTAATVAPFVQSGVASQVAGVVARVTHLAGDWVKEGEPVVILDTSLLKVAVDTAQAALDNAKINYQVGEDTVNENDPKLTLQVESAQAAVDSAQKNYESQQALLKIGGTPASTVDNALSQLQLAQANLKAAQTALEQNKKSNIWTLQQLRLAIDQAQLQLQQAQLNLHYAYITAPYAGQIAAVNVEPGMYVGTNTQVFVLVSVEKEISFNVPPSDAPNLPVGTTVQFVYQGHSFPVKVSQAPSAPINGVVPMVAAVGRNFPLPYGAVGTVTYSLNVARGAIVPIGALQTTEDKEYVFAIVDGKAVTRDVTVLGQSETDAAVSGIEDDTQVIMNPPPGLLDGTSVQIVSSGVPSAQGVSSGSTGGSVTAKSSTTVMDPGPGPNATSATPSAKP